MYVHIGIVGRDRTTQLSLALFVIVSDSVTLGERAYNNWFRELFVLLCSQEMSSSSRAVATSSGVPVCPALPAGVKLERPQPFKG